MRDSLEFHKWIQNMVIFQKKVIAFYDLQVTELWGKRDTEVVVSVVPSQLGNNFVIHHSEFNTLRPHQWLVGEVSRLIKRTEPLIIKT